jgi:hypothetical protein
VGSVVLQQSFVLYGGVSTRHLTTNPSIDIFGLLGISRMGLSLATGSVLLVRECADDRAE